MQGPRTLFLGLSRKITSHGHPPIAFLRVGCEASQTPCRPKVCVFYFRHLRLTENMKATPKTLSTGALSGCLATKSLKVFGMQGQHLLHGPTNTPELSPQMDAGTFSVLDPPCVSLKRIGCSLRTNLTRDSDEKEQKLGQSHSVGPDALVRVTPSCFSLGWAGEGPAIEALGPTVHMLFATKYPSVGTALGHRGSRTKGQDIMQNQ